MSHIMYSLSLNIYSSYTTCTVDYILAGKYSVNNVCWKVKQCVLVRLLTSAPPPAEKLSSVSHEKYIVALKTLQKHSIRLI